MAGYCNKRSPFHRQGIGSTPHLEVLLIEQAWVLLNGHVEEVHALGEAAHVPPDRRRRQQHLRVVRVPIGGTTTGQDILSDSFTSEGEGHRRDKRVYGRLDELEMVDLGFQWNTKISYICVV